MLITFKSNATAEIVMYKKHVQELFKILDKDVERGVFTTEEMVEIINKIDQYILDKNKQQDEITCSSNHDDVDDNEKFTKQEVSISARFFPLLEMIKEANKKQKNILWGV